MGSLGGKAERTTWGNDHSFKSFSDALVFHYLDVSWKSRPTYQWRELGGERRGNRKYQRRRIVSLTPDETLDESEDISTSTIIPITDISPSNNADSDFPSVLEVVGYLAALPLLAISPFLLLGLAVILLPLLAGSSLLLIVMVLAVSAAIMLPVLLGMPALFLPILLLAFLDGEQTEVLFERLPEGSGLDDKNTTLSINISDLISSLSTVTISPEKDIDWNSTTILTSNNASVEVLTLRPRTMSTLMLNLMLMKM